MGKNITHLVDGRIAGDTPQRRLNPDDVVVEIEAFDGPPTPPPAVTGQAAAAAAPAAASPEAVAG